MSVVELPRRPERPHTYPGRRSTKVWWWTVGTGAALLALVTVHMVAHHFVVDEVGGLRTYQQVLDYVSNPLILTLECLLLVAVTIHAMLGVRSVLFDFDLTPHGRRLVDVALWVLGVMTVVYGFALLAVLAWRA
jgi:succinate dehydrogenase hydrophobic anchor subunit